MGWNSSRQLHLTQYIRYGLMSLPVGTLLHSDAISYMLETSSEIYAVYNKQWQYIKIRE